MNASPAILPGDHADPSILKDGEDYYLTFSSFTSYPGLVLWHSRDLVNWRPLGAALTKNIGSVWAPELTKHEDRYYLYIPALGPKGSSIFVIHAAAITGPWSDPVDLHLEGCIDPGHVVGEDGERYLFVNGIRRVRLTADGLATAGPLEDACQPWRYPEDWVVEMFAPEGPKLLRHGEFFYLISAVGGTSGPPTSHMVTVARSRSIHGPWEDAPNNPVVRTKSEDEPWWSRGHATPVEGPDGRWWLVYHAYEAGFRTLGRQCLIEPLRWTADGWIEATGGDLSTVELPAPRGPAWPLTDDFSTNRLGVQWSFFSPRKAEHRRLRYGDRALSLKGRGQTLAETSPLTLVTRDRSYRAEVTLEPGRATGGMTLFYSERAFVGVGFTSTAMRTWHHSQEHPWLQTPIAARSVRLRLENVRHAVTWYYALDGGSWVKHPWQMEVSGFHHNVFGGFTSLKLGLFALGEGEVTFRDFVYEELFS